MFVKHGQEGATGAAQGLFNGRGALLPSVAGSGALQPRVGRLKQSIIIVGNKYRLPAKSWSAPSVAGSFFFFYILAASLAAHVEMFLLSKHHIVGGKSESERRLFGMREVLCSIKGDLFFHPNCDTVVIIDADRQRLLSSRFRASSTDLNITRSNLFHVGELAGSERV